MNIEKTPKTTPSQLKIDTLSRNKIMERMVQNIITPMLIIGNISDELNNSLFKDLTKYNNVR